MNKKNIVITLALFWFIISGGIFYYLINNDALSSDLTNTYIIFPSGGDFKAPTGYLEYYLSKEGGGMNKYTNNNMVNFLEQIDI